MIVLHAKWIQTKQIERKYTNSSLTYIMGHIYNICNKIKILNLKIISKDIHRIHKMNVKSGVRS